MMQALAAGLSLFELGAQFVIWLYIVPLILALIGLGFLRDSLRCLISRRDLPAAQRLALARYQAGQGLIGLAASALGCIAIAHRKELLQCVIGLF